jgi:hypothetical protein
MTREDVELYVSGNFDGDTDALEREIAEDPALAEVVADEARFEMLLRDAAAAATFCTACNDVVRGERCDACGAAVRPGGYTIERVLVSNAHGRMYVAHDADGKQVALKELAFVQAPAMSRIEAFEREAKFLRALEHPAIPRFVASFEEGHGVHTRYYLAQELVVGEPLDRIEQKWYREDEIVLLAKQVLAILVYLQSLSPMVIHRDIKPANLVRRADGTIALVDFGAAYVDGSTAGVTTVGTFGYMPVEQLAGIVDATTDLYALGASLLYLLTRQEPWRLAQSKTTVNVSAPLRAFLDKLTAADPRERFGSAKEALAMLDRREELVRTVAAPKRSRAAIVRTALIAGTIGAVVGGGAFAGYMLRRPQVVAPIPEMARLRISLTGISQAKLSIDGQPTGHVQHGNIVPVKAGVHRVTLTNELGHVCEQSIEFTAGHAMPITCTFVPNPTKAARFENKTMVSWSYKGAPLHDVASAIGKACGVSIVIPDAIDAKVNAELKDVPCNDAVESMLEAHALWYVYDPTAKILRISPRRQIDAERADANARPPSLHKRLPASTQKLDVDFKNVPLTDLLPMLTIGVGKQNLVMPDGINPRTTVLLKGVPWERGFEAVLEAHGLWYRYREEGKIIRIAPRRQLDAEESDERARP